MHSSCNINTSNSFYDTSRVLEDYYYYYYSSPSLFPSSPSLHNQYVHGDIDNNIESDFFQDFLPQMIQQQENHLENKNKNNNNNNNKKNENKNDDTNKRKRGGFDRSKSKKISKKDRHTKIETAQGPRDRRMRLSLNIARKFFDLQDKLGFDKASKTVEWLLTNSISAISELSRGFQQQQEEVVGANSSVSPTSELSTTNRKLEKGIPNTKNSEKNKGKKKVVRTTRPLSKQSREKARERARERTKEKMSNLQKRRELAGTTSLVDNGTSWIPSTITYHNFQQHAGFIDHQHTISELEHLSGNLGPTSIW